MKQTMKRNDDFQIRRESLKDLPEEQLEQRFWETCSKILDPMLDLAQKNTTPSIERSVLLRMGFSSPEAAQIVNHTIEKGLMGKGCGHLVYRLAKEKDLPLRDAGLMLAQGQGFDELKSWFGGRA